jgi:hypothetical protein
MTALKLSERRDRLFWPALAAAWRVVVGVGVTAHIRIQVNVTGDVNPLGARATLPMIAT